MRLSWNEIRTRAAQFAEEWRDAHYEKGETQSFYNDFFDVFGIRRRRVASFEQPVKLLGGKRGYLDLFWKSTLLVEQKSAGRDLTIAKIQALAYFPGLQEDELPRYVLLSDFQSFELYDLDEGTEVKFRLADLPRHVEAFGFVMGVQTRRFRDQDPVNLRAAALMQTLHDALLASGFGGHPLELFLVRLLFCLFADDTGIFPERGMFQALVAERTSADGADLGLWLSKLFEVLNQPEPRGIKLDEDLALFPYVNGDLFAERLPLPDFDSGMRGLLLSACTFNWDAISPAIFGALFQGVMTPKDRRAKGAHYTTETNILKVIEPLFLDDLRAEFARLCKRRGPTREKGLVAFHDRLGRLTFFDPACGCGNFLIITYRELRLLETELLKELNRDILDRLASGVAQLDVSTLTKIDVDQFYGIEIEEFPVRIAEVALWMMDHIMNVRLSMAFGVTYARIPLKKSPRILHADALETDWETFLPASRCSYMPSNPPFSGFVLRDAQRRLQMRVLARLGASGSRLDYVAAWFLKAAQYIQGSNVKFAFVATNSITQGEQVAQLWPALFDRYQLDIAFGHRTFAWGSDVRGKAHVHVVIIGLTLRSQQAERKRLFSYDDLNGEPVESLHPALTAYLFGADTLANRHLVVARARRPFADLPIPRVGSKPVDGGHLILDRSERDRLVTAHPDASAFIRPYVGGEEMLNGGDRWIVCVQDAPPERLRRWPEIRRRIEAVKAYRLSPDSGLLAKSMADRPAEFHVTVLPDRPFLALPEVSSERRSYLPVCWFGPPVVPSNQIIMISNPSLWLFGLLSSRMHATWLRAVGGRLESRYRYSTGLVYNTFPWPVATGVQRRKIERLAQAVLDARARYPSATLAALYDPDLMKPDLRRAHAALDRAVDVLYRAIPFASERERAEHLFTLYERLVTPMLAPPPQPRRGRKPN